MGQYKSVFCRKEMKYLLNATQYEALLAALRESILPDAFANSQISNLYYDTPDFLLIRRSMEKPKYKEKLRLRCYQVPGAQSPAFVEIKKKVAGIVYKRRESLTYQKALSYLAGKTPGGDSQIFRELDGMLSFYGSLVPAMFLSYERTSFKGREDSQLRLTFDRNILWRASCLDLSKGTWGRPLLASDQYLLEVKIANAMPLWLVKTLSQLKIYPISFSKYGEAYQAMLRQTPQILTISKEEMQYA